MKERSLYPAVESTTWSIHGRGKGFMGHALFSPVQSTHILQVLFFFLTSTGLATHTGWFISIMNLATRTLATSSPMALRFFIKAVKPLGKRPGRWLDI